MKATLETREGTASTVLGEAPCGCSSPGPEVLMQVKHCPLEVGGSLAQVKADGRAGTSGVKVTAGCPLPWERDQGPSARSAFPSLVTQTLVLLTIIAGECCEEKVQACL